LAWGLWEQESEMTGSLSEAERMRLSQLGMPLSSEQGLGLFDAALGVGEPLLVATNINLQGIRTLAGIGMLPSLLRTLVRTPAGRARQKGSLARRLAGVPEHEHEGVILELVRSHAAAVLGHTTPDAIDPDLTFLEAGFTSLSGLELRNSLSHATGLQLSITLIIDHPTTADVVLHLRAALKQQMGPGDAPSGTHDPPSTFAAMLDHAQAQGATAKAVALLMAASELRPAFTTADELVALPRALTISKGDVLPKLVCLPSFVAGWVPQQFARFARAFDGRRCVSALTLPGFAQGELAPGSREALVDVLARSVRHAANDDPFILVGYSIGGVLAHCVAEKLESEAAGVSGVVLIDTYESLDGDPGELLSSVMGPVLQRAGQFVRIDDTSLTTIGAYARLFVEWQPQPIAAPSLLVRASEPLDGTFAESHLRAWQRSDSVVEVLGDHFALIEDRAEQTAQAVEAWIADGQVERS